MKNLLTYLYSKICLLHEALFDVNKLYDYFIIFIAINVQQKS